MSETSRLQPGEAGRKQGETSGQSLTFEQAVLALRGRSDCSSLLADSFLDEDLEAGARRFLDSEEFEAILTLSCGHVKDGVVVDVGAGTGIASFAFAKAGARRVYSVEPDPSEVVGAGAIRRLTAGMCVEVIEAAGESIDLPDGTADLVYARQVLHHVDSLESFLSECARLMKPGGILIASREHVVTDQAQLEEFLAAHPIHQLTQCEGAYELNEYVEAIESAGLILRDTLGPMDSVVNTYPALTTHALEDLPRQRWEAKLGRVGGVVAEFGPARAWMSRRLRRGFERAPGRLYTFVAEKPK